MAGTKIKRPSDIEKTIEAAGKADPADIDPPAQPLHPTEVTARRFIENWQNSGLLDFRNPLRNLDAEIAKLNKALKGGNENEIKFGLKSVYSIIMLLYTNNKIELTVPQNKIVQQLKQNVEMLAQLHHSQLFKKTMKEITLDAAAIKEANIPILKNLVGRPAIMPGDLKEAANQKFVFGSPPADLGKPTITDSGVAVPEVAKPPVVAPAAAVSVPPPKLSKPIAMLMAECKQLTAEFNEIPDQTSEKAIKVYVALKANIGELKNAELSPELQSLLKSANTAIDKRDATLSERMSHSLADENFSALHLDADAEIKQTVEDLRAKVLQLFFAVPNWEVKDSSERKAFVDWNSKLNNYFMQYVLSSKNQEEFLNRCIKVFNLSYAARNGSPQDLFTAAAAFQVLANAQIDNLLSALQPQFLDKLGADGQTAYAEMKKWNMDIGGMSRENLKADQAAFLPPCSRLVDMLENVSSSVIKNIEAIKNGLQDANRDVVQSNALIPRIDATFIHRQTSLRRARTTLEGELGKLQEGLQTAKFDCLFSLKDDAKWGNVVKLLVETQDKLNSTLDKEKRTQAHIQEEFAKRADMQRALEQPGLSEDEKKEIAANISKLNEELKRPSEDLSNLVIEKVKLQENKNNEFKRLLENDTLRAAIENDPQVKEQQSLIKDKQQGFPKVQSALEEAQRQSQQYNSILDNQMRHLKEVFIRDHLLSLIENPAVRNVILKNGLKFASGVGAAQIKAFNEYIRKFPSSEKTGHALRELVVTLPIDVREGMLGRGVKQDTFYHMLPPEFNILLKGIDLKKKGLGSTQSFIQGSAFYVAPGKEEMRYVTPKNVNKAISFLREIVSDEDLYNAFRENGSLRYAEIAPSDLKNRFQNMLDALPNKLLRVANALEAYESTAAKFRKDPATVNIDDARSLQADAAILKTYPNIGEVKGLLQNMQGLQKSILRSFVAANASIDYTTFDSSALEAKLKELKIYEDNIRKNLADDDPDKENLLTELNGVRDSVTHAQELLRAGVSELDRLREQLGVEEPAPEVEKQAVPAVPQASTAVPLQEVAPAVVEAPKPVVDSVVLTKEEVVVLLEECKRLSKSLHDNQDQSSVKATIDYVHLKTKLETLQKIDKTKLSPILATQLAQSVEEANKAITFNNETVEKSIDRSVARDNFADLHLNTDEAIEQTAQALRTKALQLFFAVPDWRVTSSPEKQAFDAWNAKLSNYFKQYLLTSKDKQEFLERCVEVFNLAYKASREVPQDLLTTVAIFTIFREASVQSLLQFVQDDFLARLGDRKIKLDDKQEVAFNNIEEWVEHLPKTAFLMENVRVSLPPWTVVNKLFLAEAEQSQSVKIIEAIKNELQNVGETTVQHPNLIRTIESTFANNVVFARGDVRASIDKEIFVFGMQLPGIKTKALAKAAETNPKLADLIKATLVKDDKGNSLDLVMVQEQFEANEHKSKEAKANLEEKAAVRNDRQKELGLLLSSNLEPSKINESKEQLNRLNAEVSTADLNVLNIDKEADGLKTARNNILQKLLENEVTKAVIENDPEVQRVQHLIVAKNQELAEVTKIVSKLEEQAKRYVSFPDEQKQRLQEAFNRELIGKFTNPAVIREVVKQNKLKFVGGMINEEKIRTFNKKIDNLPSTAEMQQACEEIFATTRETEIVAPTFKQNMGHIFKQAILHSMLPPVFDYLLSSDDPKMQITLKKEKGLKGTQEFIARSKFGVGENKKQDIQDPKDLRDAIAFVREIVSDDVLYKLLTGKEYDQATAEKNEREIEENLGTKLLNLSSALKHYTEVKDLFRNKPSSIDPAIESELSAHIAVLESFQQVGQVKHLLSDMRETLEILPSALVLNAENYCTTVRSLLANKPESIGPSVKQKLEAYITRFTGNERIKSLQSDLQTLLVEIQPKLISNASKYYTEVAESLKKPMNVNEASGVEQKIKDYIKALESFQEVEQVKDLLQKMETLLPPIQAFRKGDLKELLKQNVESLYREQTELLDKGPEAIKNQDMEVAKLDGRAIWVAALFARIKPKDLQTPQYASIPALVAQIKANQARIHTAITPPSFGSRFRTFLASIFQKKEVGMAAARAEVAEAGEAIPVTLPAAQPSASIQPSLPPVPAVTQPVVPSAAATIPSTVPLPAPVAQPSVAAKPPAPLPPLFTRLVPPAPPPPPVKMAKSPLDIMKVLLEKERLTDIELRGTLETIQGLKPQEIQEILTRLKSVGLNAAQRKQILEALRKISEAPSEKKESFLARIRDNLTAGSTVATSVALIATLLTGPIIGPAIGVAAGMAAGVLGGRPLSRPPLPTPIQRMRDELHNLCNDLSYESQDKYESKLTKFIAENKEVIVKQGDPQEFLNKMGFGPQSKELPEELRKNFVEEFTKAYESVEPKGAEKESILDSAAESHSLRIN